MEPDDTGKRLDLAVHEHVAQYSRSRIQQWIREGRVRVNGIPGRPARTVRAGETIEIDPAEPPPLHASPEDIPLKVLYEDANLVAIDKPAGMVVHAGAGIHAGTLVNALLHRFEALSGVGGAARPGIVHRLDRYTSGVLLVAKNDVTHQSLAEQFSSRRVEKTYIALVHGKVKQETGRIDRPIARDPAHRTRMTARLGEGREAWSEYRVAKRFERFTLLEVRIGTGRTHQIRRIFPARGPGEDLGRRWKPGLGINGGIGAMGEAREHVTFYVAVADIAAALALIKARREKGVWAASDSRWRFLRRLHRP